MNKNELNDSKKNSTKKNTKKSNDIDEKKYSLAELLNTIKILEKNINDSKKVSQCTICMEDIAIDKIVTTRCNHHFCHDCFWTWCKKNNSCPNCRSDLMEKDRKAEMDLENLLERRDEIRTRIEEYYEESDDIKHVIEIRKKKLSNLDEKVDILYYNINQLENDILDMEQERNELAIYKKDPEKAMKMLDTRRKRVLKKKLKEDYRTQRSNKTVMLRELMMGELFEMNYIFPDEDDDEGTEEEYDFSEAFAIFDTEEIGEYCVSIPCRCEGCTDTTNRNRHCKVIEEVRRMWCEENNVIYSYSEPDNELEEGEIEEYDDEVTIPSGYFQNVNYENRQDRIGGESTDEEDYDSDFSDIPSLVSVDHETPNSVIGINRDVLIHHTRRLFQEFGDVVEYTRDI